MAPEIPVPLERSARARVDAYRAVWQRVKPLRRLVLEPRVVALVYRGQLGGEPAVPITLLYVGDEALAHEFEPFVGADGRTAAPRADEIFRGSLSAYVASQRRIAKAAEAADVVVWQSLPLTANVPASVLYHAFLDGALDVAPSIDAQIRRVRSRSYRRLFREVRRRGSYSTAVRHDRAAFDVFLTELHLPYIAERFGIRAQRDDPDALRSLYESRGRILLLQEGTEIVAGTLVLLGFGSSGVLTYHRNGIRDSSSIPAHLLSERTAGLELSLFQFAIDHRIRRIDLGFTPNVASDGRFVHKRRLGCSFQPTAGAGQFLLYCREGFRPSFFGHFALLSGSPQAFTLHVGYGGRTMPRLQQWRASVKNYVVPGVRRIELHTTAAAGDAAAAPYERVLEDIAAQRDLIVSRPHSA